MNEQIEAIRNEIERLYGEYKDKFKQYGDQYHLGLIDGLDMAERVLDTFSEAPDNSLEEAAEKYEKGHTYQRYDVGGLTTEYDATLAEAFITGAQWQKEQMMKEAVEGYITLTLEGVRTVAATIKEEDNIGFDDKIKIIIVKEGER